MTCRMTTIWSIQKQALMSMQSNPSLKACKYMLRIRGYAVLLFPAQELKSMTSELSMQGILDGRYKYNADGAMRSIDLKDAEMLILETSRGLRRCTSERRIRPLQGVLKAIADKYCYGDFEVFRKIKLHFVHGE